MKARIYHNPGRSQSRAALALLTERAQLEIVEIGSRAVIGRPPERVPDLL